MPIRFRCVYCDKLLGIARRKAGAVVSCPHCGEKLIVPSPEPDAAADEEAIKGTDDDKALAATAGPQLFERADFESLLQPEPTFRSGDDEPPPPVKSRSRPEPLPLDREPEFEPLAPRRAPASPGVFLSASKVTWLSVIGVILLAGAFAAGLLVGRFFRPG